MLDGKELAGAPEAGLDLVGDQQDPVPLGQLAQGAQEIERRRNEAALAEYGLDDDRGNSLGGDGRFEQLVECGERQLGAPAAVLIRKGRLVDLRGVRAEVLLVGV